MEYKKALECLKENTEMFKEIVLENKTSYKDGTVIDAYIFHFNQNHIEQALQQAEKDLEILENIKNKTNLFFSQRKQIVKEFNCWCVENNADALDSTNLVTWLLCFKLKEWLKNE